MTSMSFGYDGMCICLSIAGCTGAAIVVAPPSDRGISYSAVLVAPRCRSASGALVMTVLAMNERYPAAQRYRPQHGTVTATRLALRVALLMRPARTIRTAPSTAPPAKLPTQPSTAVPATAPISCPSTMLTQSTGGAHLSGHNELIGPIHNDR
jgi:hypothetical protein